jgi:hypothetical protein
VSAVSESWHLPQTEAVRRALRAARDETLVRDLLFLEAWEMQRTLDLAASLRASQIRRANPRLVEEIREELRTAGGPITSPRLQQTHRY